MLWPSMNTGTPGSAATARSDERVDVGDAWSMSSMKARGPSERPWPRWSTAWTA